MQVLALLVWHKPCLRPQRYEMMSQLPSKTQRHLAAQVLALLIRHGTALDAADADGQTPLHYAALCEQVRFSTIYSYADVMEARSLIDPSTRWPQTVSRHCTTLRCAARARRVSHLDTF